jgi:hypothetical protein
MTDPTPASQPPDLWRSVFESWRSPWLGLSPQQLQQPINTGWTFGNVLVTAQNSTSPEVEQAVVLRHSYGRQIGRLLDAVAALVELTGADGKWKDDPRIKAFVDMAAEVEAIKARARHSRLERLREDLEALAREDPEGFAELNRTVARK